MPSKWEKWLIMLFVDGYNREFRASYELVKWPDEEERAKRLPDQPPNIDALAIDCTCRTLAIEHTRIEAFKDAAGNDVRFKAISDALKDPSLSLPGCHIIVYMHMDVTTGLTGGERKRLAEEMKEWFRLTSPGLPEGQSHCRPTLWGRRRTIKIYKSTRGPDAGLVTTKRYPKPRFMPRLRKALDDKVEKLAKCEADRRILLLESGDYDTPGRCELAEKLRLLEKPYNLTRLDEIWLADLSSLRLDNSGNAFFYLVWPDRKLDFIQQNVSGPPS